MYRVLHVVAASACDRSYGLIFSLIVFFCLKIDHTHITQWEKIKHYAFILLPPRTKMGCYQLSAEYIICATHANYTSRVVLFIANALSAKCKLCYKSGVYHRQLGTSLQ